MCTDHEMPHYTGIRLSTFEAAKKLMAGSEAAYAEEKAKYKALKVRPVHA